eukprot:3890420-Prorocentrum_lima.AAC.1
MIVVAGAAGGGGNGRCAGAWSDVKYVGKGGEHIDCTPFKLQVMSGSEHTDSTPTKLPAMP